MKPQDWKRKQKLHAAGIEPEKSSEQIPPRPTDQQFADAAKALWDMYQHVQKQKRGMQ